MTRLMNEQLDEYTVSLDGVIQWNVFEADDVAGKIWISDTSPLGYHVKTGKVEFHEKTPQQDNTSILTITADTILNDGITVDKIIIDQMNKYLEQWKKLGII